jgi:hypothetical protein
MKNTPRGLKLKVLSKEKLIKKSAFSALFRKFPDHSRVAEAA